MHRGNETFMDAVKEFAVKEDTIRKGATSVNERALSREFGHGELETGDSKLDLAF
jgi:hypothetical protein